MFLKVGIKILFVITEVFLGFYSLVVSESLLVKFIFFALTALIIAFGMLKTINKFLPSDGDIIPMKSTAEDSEKEE